MKTAEFQEMVRESFKALCDAFQLRLQTVDGFIARLNGPEVFLRISYDAFRSHELSASVGLQAGVAHPMERPFQLSELLRVVGEHGLPEAQMQEVVVGHADLSFALDHLATLLEKYGQGALRADRSTFDRLDAQRNTDCARYQYNRALYDASREAFVAASQGQHELVRSLLGPFREQLTTDERHILAVAEGKQLRI